ncbi:Pteridine reductase [Saliniradius amylolyticus]|uniref:Pteridine reductase n=1 Tax=Saliniradius amylolyticus TaxID=2183582 RepID=A0A2S2E2F8_9ALTE|nr:pteridine reductase [Saliniradius amylolyticus]AWL11824.1 Pteridine reductase [Saliniradius amylolyticus]
MPLPEHSLPSNAVILITGAAQRLGATLARHLHSKGYRILIHYHRSVEAAEQLRSELEQQRPNSVNTVHGDLTQAASITGIVDQALARFGEVNGLINNASAFYPSPMGEIDEPHWHQLFATNTAAPLLLSQQLRQQLSHHNGCIINITDIYGMTGRAGYSLYCAAKAGLNNLTRSLALELAPRIRVNAIAPGAILWPEPEPNQQEKERMLSEIPLERLGQPMDIAKAAAFLLESEYITGHILKVDGGKSLSGC